MAADLAATVIKLNGAYLIEVHGDRAGDTTNDQTITAASSLVRAKRLARELASAFGFVGPFRWRLSDGGGLWFLEGTYVEDEDEAMAY